MKKRKRVRATVLLCGLALAFCALFAWAIVNAQYEMVRSAYGGQRMKRSEADELAANGWQWHRFLLSRLPDSEFLPEL
jgi:hypothetical protein